MSLGSLDLLDAREIKQSRSHRMCRNGFPQPLSAFPHLGDLRSCAGPQPLSAQGVADKHIWKALHWKIKLGYLDVLFLLVLEQFFIWNGGEPKLGGSGLTVPVAVSFPALLSGTPSHTGSTINYE